MRPWLAGARSLDQLNRWSEARGLRTESGCAVRFVAPAEAPGSYERLIFETGRVATRADSAHDWFNALAWLAFPRTKARLNAMHVAAMAVEKGARGRLRDMLTLFDEGGALIACGDPALERLLRAHRWKAAFWDRREAVLSSLRILVLGHAVLEKAAASPWAGLTCKALFISPAADPDVEAAAWLARCGPGATPRDLSSVPVFGYPGWLPGSEQPGFYDDERYFRPGREAMPEQLRE